MKDLFENPHVTKKERCILLLKMLPAPLFPREIDVLKIAQNIGCHRDTVYKARNELKLRYRLLHLATNVDDPKYAKLKDITLRSVNAELQGHLSYMYSILESIITSGEMPKFDGYDKERLALIEMYLGRNKDKGE